MWPCCASTSRTVLGRAWFWIGYHYRKKESTWNVPVREMKQIIPKKKDSRRMTRSRRWSLSSSAIYEKNACQAGCMKLETNVSIYIDGPHTHIERVCVQSLWDITLRKDASCIFKHPLVCVRCNSMCVTVDIWHGVSFSYDHGFFSFPFFSFLFLFLFLQWV